eukprot:828633_1
MSFEVQISRESLSHRFDRVNPAHQGQSATKELRNRLKARRTEQLDDTFFEDRRVQRRATFDTQSRQRRNLDLQLRREQRAPTVVMAGRTSRGRGSRRGAFRGSSQSSGRQMNRSVRSNLRGSFRGRGRGRGRVRGRGVRGGLSTRGRRGRGSMGRGRGGGRGRGRGRGRGGSNLSKAQLDRELEAMRPEGSRQSELDCELDSYWASKDAGDETEESAGEGADLKGGARMDTTSEGTANGVV